MLPLQVVADKLQKMAVGLSDKLQRAMSDEEKLSMARNMAMMEIYVITLKHGFLENSERCLSLLEDERRGLECFAKDAVFQPEEPGPLLDSQHMGAMLLQSRYNAVLEVCCGRGGEFLVKLDVAVGLLRQRIEDGKLELLRKAQQKELDALKQKHDEAIAKVKPSEK